jgi:DNA-binding transcriptional LysR family regulator
MRERRADRGLLFGRSRQVNKLKLMASLVAVVKTGNFTAAACGLNVSRSLLSKHITELETSLGLQLLNRDTHSVQLTELGAEYYEFCINYLEELRAAEAAIVDRNRLPEGTLKVLAPVMFGSLFMGNLTSEFVDRHPGFSVSVCLRGQTLHASELESHSFDLAIRTSLPAVSSLLGRKLAPLRNIFCATPNYIEKRGRPQTLSHLFRHPLIYHERDADKRWRFRASGGAASFKLPDSLLPQTNGLEVLRSWILEGRGIGFVPECSVYHDIQQGRLEAVLSDHEGEDRGLFVLFPNARFVPLRVRLFIDFLVEKLSTPPWGLTSPRSEAAIRPADRETEGAPTSILWRS